jgi:transposase
VRELIEPTDIVFSTMIETMLDVRRAIFDGYAKLYRVLLRWFGTIRSVGD